MARPHLPSNSCVWAEMCGHRLIQRRQLLVFFFFSTVNGCESNWSRRMDARWVGGCAIISWARMNFEEEGGQALAGGLIAPREKTLIQPAARWLLGGNHLSPSSLTASVMMQMISSSALSLVLREEDDGKRAGSVTEPSASKAARKKGCHLFCRHSHRTRSCRSQWRDADHVEWRGRTNALSLCGDGEARGHWAGVACHRPFKSGNLLF